MSTTTMSPNDVVTLRARLGLSQREMAEAAGVTRAAVTHWEAGRHVPSGPALVLLGMLQKTAAKKSRKRG